MGERVFFQDYLTPDQEEFARKWIRALRSRKFKQGGSALVNFYDGVAHHCCLGVACELSDKYHRYEYSAIFHIDSEMATVYLKNGEKFGLKTTRGDAFGLEDWDISLTFMNDNGVTFLKISRILEEDLNRELTLEKIHEILGPRVVKTLGSRRSEIKK